MAEARRRPAWLRAWQVFAVLSLFWAAAMGITPEPCNFFGRCPSYSAMGIFFGVRR